MELPQVLKEHPYYIVGGAAVGLYFLYNLMGSSSSASTVSYGGSDIATGTPNTTSSDTTSSDMANQIAASQQTTLAQVGQMLQGYQDQETQNLQSVTSSFSTALTNMQAQTQQMQQSLTQQEQQDQQTNASNIAALSSGFTQALQQIQTQNAQSIAASQASNANQLSSLQSVIQSIGQSLSNLTNKVNSAPAVGTYSPIGYTPGTTQTATVTHTFFGSDVDIANAISVYGGRAGYNFVDTQNLTPSQITSMVSAAGSGAVIVGGEKSGGGVTAQEVAGLPVVRIGGQTAQDTKTLLQSARF